MSKRALILGISGQDGGYLAQLLLTKGYEVLGTTRKKDLGTLNNLEKLGIGKRIELWELELGQFRDICRLLSESGPDEVYNLTGPSSVSDSFRHPYSTLRDIPRNTLNCLEAIRQYGSGIKYYNACSSECYGDTDKGPANEATPFRPVSPYGVAKASTYWVTRQYREAFGLFACSGIVFNHESPLRSTNFVTQKIVKQAVEIYQKKRGELTLGNIEVQRDWGWAPDYVDGMHRILSHFEATDFVLASGKLSRLDKFVAQVFDFFGLDWTKHVVVSDDLYRPAEISLSYGDSEKARRLLRWETKHDLRYIAENMVKAHLENT